MAHYPHEKGAYFSHPDTPATAEAHFVNERSKTGYATTARMSNGAHLQSAIAGFRIDELDKLNQLKDVPGEYKVQDTARPSSTDFPPEFLLPIKDCYEATVVSNERLTPKEHWQDVRLLRLLVEDNEWDWDSNDSSDLFVLNPGDTVSLIPKNFPSDVQELIDLMGWEDIADKTIKFYRFVDGAMDTVPGDLEMGHPPKDCHVKVGSTLRDLLTHNFDITAIPKRDLFQVLAAYCSNRDHKARLLEFADIAHTDEFHDYTTRPRRSILEVLQEFPSVRVPWQQALRLFPLIRAREYSIANGVIADAQSKDNTAFDPFKGPARVHVDILMAIVKYKTVLRKTRRGLTSRYVEGLPPGAQIQVMIKKNPNVLAYKGSHLLRPVLAIAAGTGIAPVRSFITERAYVGRELELLSREPDKVRLGRKEAWRKHVATMIDERFWFQEQLYRVTEGQPLAGRNLDALVHNRRTRHAQNPPRLDQVGDLLKMGNVVLFFGCRNKDADFFFADEWGKYGINVFPAFSRDPAGGAPKMPDPKVIAKKLPPTYIDPAAGEEGKQKEQMEQKLVVTGTKIKIMNRTKSETTPPLSPSKAYGMDQPTPSKYYNLSGQPTPSHSQSDGGSSPTGAALLLRLATPSLDSDNKANNPTARFTAEPPSSPASLPRTVSPAPRADPGPAIVPYGPQLPSRPLGASLTFINKGNPGLIHEEPDGGGSGPSSSPPPSKSIEKVVPASSAAVAEFRAKTAKLDRESAGEGIFHQRQTARKTYVQDVIRENPQVVCDMVRAGCAIVLCGSTGAMPREVKAALREALVLGGLAKDDEMAERALALCTWWQETW